MRKLIFVKIEITRELFNQNFRDPRRGTNTVYILITNSAIGR